MSFQKFGLPTPLRQNLRTIGYVNPTPIQTQAIRQSPKSSAPVGAPYTPASGEDGGSIGTPTANASRGRMRMLPTVSYPAGASG
jgi:hypothetical protein